MAEASDTPSAPPAQRENPQKNEWATITSRFDDVRAPLADALWLAYAARAFSCEAFEGSDNPPKVTLQASYELSRLTYEALGGITEGFDELQVWTARRYAP